MGTAHLALLWHQHQPYYREGPDGEYAMPWVRLHGIKDYYGMAWLASQHPDVHMTFNVVPSLLVQVEEGVLFDLAEPGAIIDHSKPAAPADIDTGTLEALPPNTGSLEDCHHEKPPRKIPDISHLKLVDD